MSHSSRPWTSVGFDFFIKGEQVIAVPNGPATANPEVAAASVQAPDGGIN